MKHKTSGTQLQTSRFPEQSSRLHLQSISKFVVDPETCLLVDTLPKVSFLYSSDGFVFTGTSLWEKINGSCVAGLTLLRQINSAFSYLDLTTIKNPIRYALTEYEFNSNRKITRRSAGVGTIKPQQRTTRLAGVRSCQQLNAGCRPTATTQPSILNQAR
jgi:hypothetical protein